MNGLGVFGVTVLLIILSAFFVIIEFSLMGARRQRLEAQAATSASSRAALRGMNELTIMLAAAQLGITACTFGLGAVTKPAMEYWLGPTLIGLGLPEWIAGVLSFALSLLVVTFLHLVIGEMAPKSWAIAHPERAAKIIGIGSRIYIWPLKPFLQAVNSVANLLVRSVGVTPVERAAVGGRDAATIAQLVEHSAKLGVLDPELQSQISEAIRLQEITAGDMVTKTRIPTSVPMEATVRDVHETSQATGRLRILVRDDGGRLTHVVHVRDTLTSDPGTPIRGFMRPCFLVESQTPVYEMLEKMKAAGVQLAIVNDRDGKQHVISIRDVIARLLP
jgi:CBS domain containing-hemolysin-like protein